jgi:hypothetical protein
LLQLYMIETQEDKWKRKIRSFILCSCFCPIFLQIFEIYVYIKWFEREGAKNSVHVRIILAERGVSSSKHDTQKASFEESLTV